MKLVPFRKNRMPIKKIDDTFCIIGSREDSQRYYDDCDDDLFTWVFCPVCDMLLRCKFSKDAPDWIFIGNPGTGTFEVKADTDPYWASPEHCTFYSHKFIVSYVGQPVNHNDFTVVKQTFNQIVPFQSSVTELLVEQAILLKWYERELSYISNTIVTFPGVTTYLKKMLSWDSPWKCELFANFEKRLCKDIARYITDYIDWLTYEPKQSD